MTRFITFSTALLLAGTALAQVAPPPPPPVATSSSAGSVSSVGIDSLKAVFDEAGVPYEVKAYDDGFPYLQTTPEGYLMYVSLVDCPDAKPVACGAIAMSSGSWDRKSTPDELNQYNSRIYMAKAAIQDLSKGTPSISHTTT